MKLAPVTKRDLDILLEDGFLTFEEAAEVEVVSMEEMHNLLIEHMAQAYRRLAYDRFWSGYAVASADAAAALAAVERPSLLRRLGILLCGLGNPQPTPQRVVAARAGSPLFGEAQDARRRSS